MPVRRVCACDVRVATGILHGTVMTAEPAPVTNATVHAYPLRPL